MDEIEAEDPKAAWTQLRMKLAGKK